MNIIKCRFLKCGVPSGGEYSYFSDTPVAVGDTVQINDKAKGVVTTINVPEGEVEAFKDKVKTIVGKVAEKKPFLAICEDHYWSIVYAEDIESLKSIISLSADGEHESKIITVLECNKVLEEFINFTDTENGGNEQ